MNDMKRCFAQEGDGCKVLTVKKCKGYECSFFKTPEDAEASRKKANQRLASLDAETQAHIADTYYGGKKPWLNAGNIK